MIDPAFQQEYEFTRCKYPSKVCPNMRTRKRNGQLHRFCEMHRARANQNQKRWSASRVKRWDSLSQPLRPGYNLRDDDFDDDSGAVKAEPYTDATLYGGALFPMASLDGYNYGGDLSAFPIAESTETSWQDAATEELREFLGDLLVSIAADDAPVAPLPPAPVEPVATAQPWHW